MATYNRRLPEIRAAWGPKVRHARPRAITERSWRRFLAYVEEGLPVGSVAALEGISTTRAMVSIKAADYRLQIQVEALTVTASPDAAVTGEAGAEGSAS